MFQKRKTIRIWAILNSGDVWGPVKTLELGGREYPVVARIGWAHPDGARQWEEFCTIRGESRVQNMVKCSEVSVLWTDEYV